MRARCSTALWCAVLLLLAGACATRPPNPAAAPPPLPPGTGTPLLSEPEVASARELYIAKCTRCHRYYPPSAYDDAKWDFWMRKMSRKARLKPDEDAALRDYLELYRR